MSTTGHAQCQNVGMDEKSVIGGRIRHFREAAELSRTELMSRCGWTGAPSRIGNYELGKNMPSIPDLTRIAHALGVEFDQLAFGKGAQDGAFVTVRGPSAGRSAEVEVKFHRRASASAGPGRSNGDTEEEPLGLRFRAESLKRRGIDHDCAMVIYADGDSMEPLIGDGDTILFDTSKKDVQDGRIYVIEIDDETLVKRLHRRPGGRILVHSENPAYAPYEVSSGDAAHFRILGRVMWGAGWL